LSELGFLSGDKSEIETHRVVIYGVQDEIPTVAHKIYPSGTRSSPLTQEPYPQIPKHTTAYGIHVNNPSVHNANAVTSLPLRSRGCGR
jgi:hypothetical protein